MWLSSVSQPQPDPGSLECGWHHRAVPELGKEAGAPLGPVALVGGVASQALPGEVAALGGLSNPTFSRRLVHDAGSSF